jgi:HK97 family phage major capsid protein
MKRPKGTRPKLTAEEIKALQAKRAEYLGLDRAGRTAFLVRELNQELEQERYFTGSDSEGEERTLDVDLEKRIVRDVSFASDEPYMRWYGWEILDHTPGKQNFKRLNNGGAFLREHWGEQLGVVVKKSAKLDGNKSRCDLFFSERQEAVYELNDIAQGIRCNTSLRYTVDAIKFLGTADDGEDKYLVEWTPIHVASVSDPADFSVGFGKSLEASVAPPANPGGPATSGAGAETRSVPPSPNNPSEQSETAPVKPGAVRSKRSKRRVRKSMALRKLKKKKDAVECKATDPVCENEDCRVHYEDDDEDEDERGAEVVTNYSALFRAIAKAAALGPVEEKRFLLIASDRALEDKPDEAAFRKALREDRKKHANDNQPEEEDPEVVAARMNGEGPIDVSLRAVGKLRNFKTEKEAVRYGKFLAGGVFKMDAARRWCKDHGIRFSRANDRSSGQSESDNESGSIWVPQEFDSTVIDLRERVGVVRQFARITQMASATKVVRRVKGGMKAKPVGAVGTSRKIQEQKKTWNSFELVARKWGIITKIEDELTEDSLISMADDIIGEQSRGFAEAEDDAFVNADGTSTFHGIVGVSQAFKNLHATIANIAGLQVASGNLWSEIVMGDFTKLVAKLPQYADNERAAFYCSRSFFFGVMVPIMLAAGGVTAGEIQNMRQKVFLGYPVHIIQWMPRVEDNSQVCCYFGDAWAAIDFGDRRGIMVRQTDSNDDDFENDLIAIKSTERIDLVPHDVGNASATAGLRVPGPLVALITAAS